MAFFRGPKIVTENLRFLLDAKNVKSYPGTGTTWTDLSGFNNNFTNSNTTFNSEGYFTYNGTSSGSTGSTPNSFSADNNVSTIGVWFRPHDVSPIENKAIITDNFGPEYGIWLLTNGNISGYAYGNVQTSIVANEWTYCVLTAILEEPTTGSYTIEFYKDGEYINQATGTNGNGANDWPFYLGFDNKGGAPAGYFDGDIARVEIYQKILTATEVKQNWNAIKGRFGL